MKKKQITNTIKVFGMLVIPWIPFFFNYSRDTNILWFIFTPAYIVFALRLFYDSFDVVKFYFDKFVLWIINKEIQWSMSAVYHGEINEETLDQISKTIINHYQDSVLWQDDNAIKIIKLAFGGSIKIEISNYRSEDNIITRVLNFVVTDFSVPFRSSEKVLDKLLVMIDKCIIQVLNPTKQKYTFKVSFIENNPYYGLFVKRLTLDDKNNIHFSIDFTDRIGSANGKIEISPEKVILSVTDLKGLKMFAGKYITLSYLSSPEI
jgi:hypothetical protein